MLESHFHQSDEQSVKEKNKLKILENRSFILEIGFLYYRITNRTS